MGACHTPAVRRARFALLLLALLAALSVVAPSGALADGCNGSAGDTQYFDPLQPCSNQPPPTTSTPSTTPTTAPPSTTTVVPAVASTAKAADPKSSKSLPYTGLDLGPAVLLGVVLLGGGVVLRRLITRRETG